MGLLFLVILAALFLLIWKVTEASATSIVYKVPFRRLFNPRWATTQTTLTYVFRGRAWYDLRPTPMKAVFWFGHTGVETRETALRIAEWANENKVDNFPSPDELVDAINLRNNDTYGRHTPDQVLAYLEEWRQGKHQIHSVVEV